MRYELKQRRRRPVLLCLVALLSAALSPGCGSKDASSDVAPSSAWFDDLRERIRDEFDDPAQVVALTGVVDRMEATMTELDRDVVDYYTKIGALDRDYAATREQFESLIDEFNEKQRSAFEKLLVNIAELKRIAGPEGWKKLSDIDQTLYDSWQRELQP